MMTALGLRFLFFNLKITSSLFFYSVPCIEEYTTSLVTGWYVVSGREKILCVYRILNDVMVPPEPHLCYKTQE